MMLENILADFELLDDWEDRYRYVIELGRSLPPLPEAARAEANKMRGRRPGRRVWRSRAAYGLSISSQR
jgi:sulfur transfer protein SufE